MQNIILNNKVNSLRIGKWGNRAMASSKSVISRKEAAFHTVLLQEIKNDEAKNVALVFQCLTGEGAARLAAMVALLSLDNPQLSADQSEQ